MSRNSTARITVIQTRIHKSFMVRFDNGKHEIVHISTQPRRAAAIGRLIKTMNKCTIGGRDPMTEYSPAIRIIPLSEHFANAAVLGLKSLKPEDASSFESAAAEAESWVYGNGRAYDFNVGQIRRAVTYRWYARTLISGKVDRAALIAALDGIN